MTIIKTKLADSKLASSREYRQAFAAAFLKRYIPFQIRTIRKKRGLSQPALAKEAKISQGVISRAEDPDNGNLTFNTALNVAGGFDLAFIGKFVTFSELQEIVDEMSEDAFDIPSFTKECELEADADVKKHSLAGAKVGDDLSFLHSSMDAANKIIENVPLRDMNIKSLAGAGAEQTSDWAARLNTAIDIMEWSKQPEGAKVFQQLAASGAMEDTSLGASTMKASAQYVGERSIELPASIGNNDVIDIEKWKQKQASRASRRRSDRGTVRPMKRRAAHG